MPNDPLKMNLEKSIPPNGFIGSGSQTPATQQLLGQAMSGPARKKRRKTKKKTARKRVGARPIRGTRRKKKTTTRRAPRKRGPLKKGSPAAKRRMAELRRIKARKSR